MLTMLWLASPAALTLTEVRSGDARGSAEGSVIVIRRPCNENSPLMSTQYPGLCGRMPFPTETTIGGGLRENAEAGSVVGRDARFGDRDLGTRNVHGHVDDGAGECLRNQHRPDSIKGHGPLLAC
jgi:hypothetical protein